MEPGILRTLVWFEWLRLAVVGILLLPRNQAISADTRAFATIAAIEVAALLLMLTWPNLTHRMGGWFLPLVLGVATMGPIIEVAVATRVRLQSGVTGDDALVHAVQLLFLLFVPLVLLAWQYRFRTVAVYAVSVVLVESALTVGAVRRAGDEVTIGPALLALQLLLFLFVGGVVTRLATDQRRARAMLAEHAVMQEEVATERERTRIARELHDTLAHEMSGIAVQLEAAKANWEADPDGARAMIERSLATTREGLGELRRAISALRAGPVEAHGLISALEKRADLIRTESGVEVATSLGGLDQLGDDGQHAVYRIVDEALVNIARHADATHAVVQVVRSNGAIHVRVSDDGKGFDATAVDAEHHHGLMGARERAELAGGRLTIDSAPGAGTTVALELPL